MRKLFLVSTFALCSFFGKAQTFYDINTIQTIEINFSETNWDYLMDTAKAGFETNLMAQWVKINGVQFDSVGVRYKGNSTYNAAQVKNPLHIELNDFINQDYQGYTDIKLSNIGKDPSMVREVLGYSILRQYMAAPLSNYANVYINGTLIGIYASSESIADNFNENHFYSNSGTAFKCNPPAGAGPGTTDYPDLVYQGTDSTFYYDGYELKSNYGWADLIKLTDTLKNYTSNVEKILDVDRALWMLAFNNTIVNLDSYIGTFKQNYYLYRDETQRFNTTIWDLNESFGTFSMTGTISLSSTTAKQQMTHLLHSGDANWPLVQKLLAVPMYKRMYIAHMRTILSENFASGTYFTTAQNLQTLITPSVTADVNKFYTLSQFTSNLTTDVSSGMTSAPGLTNLMGARNTWLMAQTDFTYSTPTITGIAATTASPIMNNNDTILATVTNANINGVYLGYRYDVKDAFKRILMYDDGAHGDGAAADNVFGVEIPINASYVQYYIYAENNNAGMFSPQRAEYEYYTLYATISMMNAGDVTINELLAINTSTVTDPNGDFSDYIEFYNNTSSIVSMDNAYLSDDYTTPLKWAFPNNTTIAPGGYLIVWADSDTLQSGLHSNFKLSGTGEQVMLSYASGTIIDSVTYGAQTANTSYARCANGIGSFITHYPTYMSFNCLTGIDENDLDANIRLFPNPASIDLTISSDKEFETIEIYNTLSQLIFSVKVDETKSHALNISGLSNGIYFIKVDNKIVKKVSVNH
ncbi:MAG: CotH kinase family protein [Bacteroidetes bacterium]|nr:CotH kinase family protein [Bacteroidota bacterium]